MYKLLDEDIWENHNKTITVSIIVYKLSHYKDMGFVKGSGMYGVLHTSVHEISAWVEMF